MLFKSRPSALGMSGPIMVRIHLWEKLRGLEGEEKDHTARKGEGGRGEGEEKHKHGRYPVGPTNIAYFASFKPFSE